MCQLAVLPAGYAMPMVKDDHQPIEAYVNMLHSMGKYDRHRVDAYVNRFAVNGKEMSVNLWKLMSIHCVTWLMLLSVHCIEWQ